MRIKHSKKDSAQHLFMLIATVVVLLAITSLLILAIFIISFNSKESDYANKRDIFSDSDFQQLFQDTLSSSNEQKNYLYQSADSNFEVIIDTTLNSIEEDSNGITIYPKTSNPDYVVDISVEPIIQLVETDLNSEVDKFKAFLSGFPNSNVEAEGDIVIDSSAGKKIVYSKTGLGDFKTYGIYVVAVKNGFVYKIEYKGLDESFPNEEALEEYTSSLHAIDSSAVEKIISYFSNLWGYQFDYNSRFWQLNTISPEIISLVPRKYQINEEKTNLSIKSHEVSRDSLLNHEQTYLDDFVKSVVSNLPTLDENTGGIQILNQSSIDVNGRKAIELVYQRNNDDSDFKFVKSVYFLHFNAITEVTIESNSYDKLGDTEAATIINSFQFSEPTAGRVKGVSDLTFNERAAAFEAIPAIKKVYGKSCVNLTFEDNSSIPNLSNKSYEICGIVFGFGVYVNSNGYAITNLLSSDFSNLEIVDNSINYGYSKQLLVDAFKDFYLPALANNDASFQSFSDDQIINFLYQNRSVLNEIAKMVSNSSTFELGDRQDSFYIQAGNVDFEFDDSTFNVTNLEDHHSAVTVNDLSQPSDDKAELIVLKVEESEADLPALSVSNSGTFESGKKHTVLRFSQDTENATYPIAEDQNKLLLGSEAVELSDEFEINDAKITGLIINHNSELEGFVYYSYGENSVRYQTQGVTSVESLLNQFNIAEEVGENEKLWRVLNDKFWDAKFASAIDSSENLVSKSGEYGNLETLLEIARSKDALGLSVRDDSSLVDSFGINDFYNELSAQEKVVFGSVVFLAGFITFLIILASGLMLRHFISVKQK